MPLGRELRVLVSAKDSPPLRRDHVHVWCVPLDTRGARVAELAGLLSAEERTRAARYRFDNDRRRFVIARGMLRALLARYLGASSNAVEISYRPGGKPVLTRATRLEFNLSHSQALAVYAFGLDRPVGVDVEDLARPLDCLALARRFFSARELAMLRSLPPDLRPRRILVHWTRREALLKATGQGLLGLAGLDLSGLPWECASPMPMSCDALAGQWSVCDLDLGRHHVSTLVAQGQHWTPLLCNQP
jgi:4'-phosphopantetheinyl transferase